MPDHAHQQQRVDVAAGEHDHDRRLEGVGSSSSAATAAAPAGSTTSLARSSSSSRARDSDSSRDGHDLVDVLLDRRRTARRPGSRPRCRRPSWPSCSSGDRARPLRARRGTPRRPRPARPTTRDVGTQRLDRGGDAGEQPAAAGRHDDGPDVGALLEDLQADGALPGDDVGVVEGVDQHRAGLGRRTACARDERLVDGRARGSAPRRRTRGWPSPWGSARPSGMNTVAWMPSSCAASATPCAWLPALAATTPRGLLLVGQPGDPHVGAADLERAGALEVLALSSTGPPASSESQRDPSIGVWIETPSSGSRAAWMSSRVGMRTAPMPLVCSRHGDHPRTCALRWSRQARPPAASGVWRRSPRFSMRDARNEMYACRMQSSPFVLTEPIPAPETAEDALMSLMMALGRRLRQRQPGDVDRLLRLPDPQAAAATRARCGSPRSPRCSASTPRRSAGTPGSSRTRACWSAPRTPTTAAPAASPSPSTAAPVWRRASRPAATSISTALDGWSDDERETLRTLLARLVESLLVQSDAHPDSHPQENPA